MLNGMDKQNEWFPGNLFGRSSSNSLFKISALIALSTQDFLVAVSIHEYLNAKSNAIYEIELLNNSFTMISLAILSAVELLNNFLC